MNVFTLDVRTLSLMTTCIAVLFSVWLLAFGVSQKRFKGFYLFSSASASMALGLLFLSLRRILPDFITIIVANTLIISGLIFYFEGSRRFLKVVNKIHPVSVTLFLLHLLTFFYYTYINPSINDRIMALCASSAFITMFTAVNLFRNQKLYWRIPAMTMGSIFMASSLFQVFHLFWTMKEGYIEFFLQVGNVHALSWIFVIAIVIGPPFGFVWMASKELEFNLIEVSNRDQLTDALNRRGLESAIKQQFFNRKKSLNNSAVLMIDIDYFKKINDTYGHEVGDEVLASFVEVLYGGLRPSDIFARVGGEEFVVIFPDVTLDQVFLLAENLRESIESFIFNIHGHKIRITASFGLVMINSKSITLDEMLRYADKALYYSKRHGRNRVTSFSEMKDRPL